MTVRIVASRHSAFYSPLLAAIAAGFLREEGMEADYGVLQPGQRSQTLIREGTADVMQSAVASNWKAMERGEAPLPVHFAQINRRDGFVLVARPDAPSFQWTDLERKTLLADHGRQPFVMLQYAAHRQGVQWSRLQVVDAGSPEDMEAAFRAGAGDFVHLQCPAPQQLESDGVGKIVARVGDAMPPVAFSSLCASREFVASTRFRPFLRAFRKAKEWVRSASPEEVAASERTLFPSVDATTLAAAVRYYQSLGCWDGGVEIPRALYEQALNVFEWAGDIAGRLAYDDVCLPADTGG
ncbi:MAG: ABC transporter substrate-binding protein [Bryobacteraceae bacterium]